MNTLTPLRLARLEAGLSQWDVCKSTGIHQTTISLYEREVKVPSPNHLEILSELYRKPMEQLCK
jgi:transcriptional regulator with XRE-family HTH domain